MIGRAAAGGRSGRRIRFGRRSVQARETSLPKVEHVSHVTDLRRVHEPGLVTLSSGGKRIARVLHDPCPVPDQIWIMNVDGTEPTQLTRSEVRGPIDPVGSSDGRRLVFLSNSALPSTREAGSSSMRGPAWCIFHRNPPVLESSRQRNGGDLQASRAYRGRVHP